MWILSYDNKKLVKAYDLAVTKNFTAKKDEKYAIVATTKNEQVVVAVFADEKTAVDALVKAHTAFGEGIHSYKFG